MSDSKDEKLIDSKDEKLTDSEEEKRAIDELNAKADARKHLWKFDVTTGRRCCDTSSLQKDEKLEDLESDFFDAVKDVSKECNLSQEYLEKFDDTNKRACNVARINNEGGGTILETSGPNLEKEEEKRTISEMKAKANARLNIPRVWDKERNNWYIDTSSLRQSS